MSAVLILTAGCAAPGNPVTLEHRSEFHEDYLVVKQFGEMKSAHYGSTPIKKAREEAYLLAKEMCFDEFRTILSSIVDEVGYSTWSGDRVDFLKEVDRKDEKRGCWLTMRVPLSGSRSVSELLGYEGIVVK